MSIERIASHIPKLLSWFETVRRPLPWRARKPDPYRVWISEIMSQQSTMATVVPYFQRWVEKFPHLDALAAAHEDDVVAAWAGLGYYSRARNVLKAARELLEFRRLHHRAWPQTAAEWLSFSGVGPYTAAAVAAICFEDRVLPLDGNVLRVLSRLKGVQDALNASQDRRQVETYLRALAETLAQGQHGHVGQALMELGSLVCRPGPQARCAACPLQEVCEAYSLDKVADTPRPKKRPEARRLTTLALVYRDRRGAVLLRKIPEGHRLAGQWELPLMEWPRPESPRELLGKSFEVSPGPVKHLITHHIYSVHKVEAGRWTDKAPVGHVLWNPKDPPPGTLTTLSRKILLI